MTTKIEWCDETWNPITGCTPISEGCHNCYAARMAKRLAGRFGYPKDDPFKPGVFHYEKICYEPDIKMFKPGKKIFVCSMGDLFHEAVSLCGDQLNDVFNVIRNHQENIFIVLTKRPKRMKAFFDAPGQMFFFEDNPHVWLGVTTENQRTADERIPILLQIPAAIRFVSVEPMLSEIDLSEWLECSGMPDFCDGKKLDWVIVGGETGPGARRPMPDWVRSLKNQCIAVNVPFFFKGWGAYWPQQEFYKIGKKHFGRLLDGVEWNQFPNADPLSAGVAPWFHRAPENALKGL